MNRELVRQLRFIHPSVPDALYRRLMREERLSYLRQGETITGFELTDDSDLVNGYTFVALNKHKILCYRSDENEGKDLKLVLFPYLENVYDSAYAIQDLKVTRKVYKDAEFEGAKVEEGRLIDVIQDLLPQDDVSDTMTEVVSEEEEVVEKQPVKEKVISEVIETPQLSRREQLERRQAQHFFSNVHDITDYVVSELNVHPTHADKLLESIVKALRDNEPDIKDTDYMLMGNYIKLLGKALDNGKI